MVVGYLTGFPVHWHAMATDGIYGMRSRKLNLCFGTHTVCIMCHSAGHLFIYLRRTHQH